MKTFLMVAMTALLAFGAYAKDQKNTTKTRTTDLLQFDGTISNVNTQQQTITVTGHEVLQVIIKERTRSAYYRQRYQNTQTKTQTKEAPKETTKTFKVNPSCKIVTATKLVTLLSGLTQNEKVIVEYNSVETAEGTVNEATNITEKK